MRWRPGWPKPFAGFVVFRAKRADRVKIVVWDGSGLVLIYKRLEAHCWTHARRQLKEIVDRDGSTIAAEGLA